MCMGSIGSRVQWFKVSIGSRVQWFKVSIGVRSQLIQVFNWFEGSTTQMVQLVQLIHVLNQFNWFNSISSRFELIQGSKCSTSTIVQYIKWSNEFKGSICSICSGIQLVQCSMGSSFQFVQEFNQRVQGLIGYKAGCHKVMQHGSTAMMHIDFEGGTKRKRGCWKETREIKEERRRWNGGQDEGKKRRKCLHQVQKNKCIYFQYIGSIDIIFLEINWEAHLVKYPRFEA